MSTMKLSEAIRLGAMGLPEARGPVFYRDGGTLCGACAIGAALYAVGRASDANRFVEAIHEQWPWTADNVRHPVWDLEAGEATGTIVNLFEYHLWTREQIADWVETLERRADAEGRPQPETVTPAVRPVPQKVFTS